MSASDPAGFVTANTAVMSAPLVPEISLHLASEVVPLWQATEADLARTGYLAAIGGDVSAQQLIEMITLQSGGEHLDNIKAATGTSS